MHVLLQVLDETLRLFPSASLQRTTPKGGLDLLGYHIPEGTWIMVSGSDQPNTAKRPI